MNRIDRISALLIQLQSRPIVKAGQMAERFGVSLRTIYRDIRSLSEAGVPICGDAGVGYSLAEGYRLPPLMFTHEEAMAFVTAEKFIEQLTDEHHSRYFRQGMDKVRAVLRSVDKNDLALMGDSIEVYRSNRLPKHKHGNLLHTLLSSINRQKAVKMVYYTPSRDDHTERLIEAVGVSYVYPYWYLTAYCHLRQEYRHFRVDRIEQLTATDRIFTREHPPLKELLSEFDDPSCLIKVVLRTTSETALKMGNQRYFFGMISETEISKGVVEQTYMSYALEYMARWALSFGDTTQVIEPIELKEMIKDIINKITL